MTCKTYELGFLRWFFDNNNVGIDFVCNLNQSFPFTIYNEMGVLIEASGASAESAQSDTFNGTSLLSSTTLALSKLNVSYIRCGSNAIMSEPIDLTMLECKCMIDE